MHKWLCCAKELCVPGIRGGLCEFRHHPHRKSVAGIFIPFQIKIINEKALHISNLDVSQSNFLKELLRETFSPLFCHAFVAENVTLNIQRVRKEYCFKI